MVGGLREEREWYTPPPWLDLESVRDIDSELIDNIKRPHKSNQENFNTSNSGDDCGR